MACPTRQRRRAHENAGNDRRYPAGGGRGNGAARGRRHATPEDDEQLRATIIGPQLPRDGEEVARLLDEGADPNAQDAFGRTAVHYAAGEHTGIGGTGAILTLLLVKGGDCCMKDSQGDTPLHYAVAEGIDQVADYADVQGRIQRLLEHGADPNEPNNRGYTALHFAAKTPAWTHGPALVESLLQAGADSAAAGGDGNTPLHLAAGAPVILDHGHGHDLHSRSFLTSHAIAHSGDDSFIVRTLLAGDARPNAVNDAGLTPLLVALTRPAVHDNPAVAVAGTVDALLASGADPNAAMPDDMTPLLLILDLPDTLSLRAHRMTETAIPLVRALLGAGADANRKNPQGDTPLHMAVRHEWGEEMVEALLAGGADPCIRNDNEKWLPEQLARGLGQSAIEVALQLAGGSADECGKRKEDKLGLDRDGRRRIQSCLKAEGFDPGAPDGLFGPRTRAAISAWQEAQDDGDEATGYLTQDQLDALTAACKRAAFSPLCTGETDTPCWMETANQPGCYRWNSKPQPEETVTWSGLCVGGKAWGVGEITWRFRKDGEWKTSGGEGELREGKTKIGHWVNFYSNGNRAEGTYVDGERQGHWVWHLSDGDTWEGPYVDGKLHGLWVERGTQGKSTQCWIRGEPVDAGLAVCASVPSDRKIQAMKGIALRSGPGDDYEQIGWLYSDNRGTVSREGTGWAWIETDLDQGFVPLSALKEVEEPAMAAVVTEPKCVYGPEIHIDSELFDGDIRRVDKRLFDAGILYDNCWVEVENMPECYVFEGPRFRSIPSTSSGVYEASSEVPRPEITWTGECVNGVVSGHGELRRSVPDYDIGPDPFGGNSTFIDGKRHERVSQTYRANRRKVHEEGVWENGLRQGKFTYKSDIPGSGEQILIVNFRDGIRYGIEIIVHPLDGCKAAYHGDGKMTKDEVATVTYEEFLERLRIDPDAKRYRCLDQYY